MARYNGRRATSDERAALIADRNSLAAHRLPSHLRGDYLETICAAVAAGALTEYEARPLVAEAARHYVQCLDRVEALRRWLNDRHVERIRR